MAGDIILFEPDIDHGRIINELLLGKTTSPIIIVSEIKPYNTDDFTRYNPDLLKPYMKLEESKINYRKHKQTCIKNRLKRKKRKCR